jgi:hypothetical protein
MQTPKTISDLPRWLREQFETFQHLDTFGLPDHGDFDGFEAAALVNECQRVACGFGAPLVGDEQTVTSIRAGVETFGRLLAWAVVRANGGRMMPAAGPRRFRSDHSRSQWTGSLPVSPRPKQPIRRNGLPYKSLHRACQGIPLCQNHSSRFCNSWYGQ